MVLVYMSIMGKNQQNKTHKKRTKQNKWAKPKQTQKQPQKTLAPHPPKQSNQPTKNHTHKKQKPKPNCHSNLRLDMEGAG